MKPLFNFFFTPLLCSLIFSTTANSQTERSLDIAHLTGDFYVYTTYNYYKGHRIGANGLYLVTEKGVVLVDSPWDTTQFQPLLDTIHARHNKKVIMCIATHFHDDRTGGLEYYSKLGIKTYTTRETDQLSVKRNMKRAEYLLDSDTSFSIGTYRFETYYPGPGHAPDNIVVWFPQEKILYGGCLVKSVDDENLGNLGDSDVKAYAKTIEKVIKRFPRPSFVIPGHGNWHSTSSLQNTLKMAKELKQE